MKSKIIDDLEYHLKKPTYPQWYISHSLKKWKNTQLQYTVFKSKYYFCIEHFVDAECLPKTLRSMRYCAALFVTSVLFVHILR